MAATLAVLEFAVRWMPAGPRYRAETAYFNTSKMPLNSLGFHDYEYSPEKGPRVFRIMVVGDSFSDGAGLDFNDSYPKRLERYLNTYGNDRKITYEVMNMSWPGRSTPEEVRLLREYALHYHSDLVILGYCINDAEDLDTLDEIYALKARHPELGFKKPSGWGRFVYDRSALARLVYRRVFNTINNRCYRKYYKGLYRDEYQGWKKTRAALMELGTLSRAHGIPVEVLIFPLFSFSMGEDYPFRHIHNMVHRACEEAGLPYIDLLQSYSKMNHIRLEYIPDKDPHPDEIAHRIAAEVLWRNLIRSGLLPGGLRSERGLAFPGKCPRFISD
ncbi:MAG: SGNH/GDSL hydrolase family protein [Candidatus Aureabacteria bacterium]|nr:SGNH/GDSL hydrolase family protein [Candidatus Auribacterota bacterium]